MSLSEHPMHSSLSGLKNYQINSKSMVSAGMPSNKEFAALKAIGVTQVIDLLPGDRTQESELMKHLDLQYHNIAVEWNQPSLANFEHYVMLMEPHQNSGGITLTHCRLNWRGAVFTYLYRVIRLKESDAQPKADMLAIWEPNSTWQEFIERVKMQY